MAAESIPQVTNGEIMHLYKAEHRRVPRRERSMNGAEDNPAATKPIVTDKVGFHPLRKRSQWQMEAEMWYWVRVVLQLPFPEGIRVGSHRTDITENHPGLELGNKSQVNPGYLRFTDL